MKFWRSTGESIGARPLRYGFNFSATVFSWPKRRGDNIWIMAVRGSRISSNAMIRLARSVGSLMFASRTWRAAASSTEVLTPCPFEGWTCAMSAFARLQWMWICSQDAQHRRQELSFPWPMSWAALESQVAMAWHLVLCCDPMSLVPNGGLQVAYLMTSCRSGWNRVESFKRHFLISSCVVPVYSSAEWNKIDASQWTHLSMTKVRLR